MEQSLTEQLNSMMQSVSKNIGLYDLTKQPLYTGRNSQIFHIANRNDRKSHALKVFKKRVVRKTEDIVRAAYQKQRKIHQSLKNRYIVQLENAFMDENSLYLVLEYCSKGNLRSFMKEKQTIETIKQLASQIAKGLSYLHKGKIAHGDLKPENILLTAQGQVKICDFGKSFKFEEKGRNNMRGDFLYAPPEAIENANQYRDIWSFGCILYEMVTGKVPFAIKSWKELAITLTPEFLKNYSYANSISPTLLHLLKQMFVHDYTKRLKIQQILMHPFFTNEPLVNTLITQKSQEIKERKPKSSRSKPSFRSLQLKENTKQNKNTINVLISNQPDYKRLLEKKFKEEKSRGTSKQNSDHKPNNKPLEEGGRSGKTQLTYNVIKSAFQSHKTVLSPLKTQGLIMKEIQKKKNKIKIDKEGFTRCGQTDWMNISCDGKIIRLRKNGAEKKYNFESLPEKYYDMYEQAKKIVKEAKSWTPKMTYKDQQLDLSIMFSGSISAKYSYGPQFKDIQLQKILKNSLNLDQQRISLLQNVTLALMSIQRK